MSMSGNETGVFVDAWCAWQGVVLAPESRAGVIGNLQRIADMAALLNQFALDANVESAPRFEP